MIIKNLIKKITHHFINYLKIDQILINQGKILSKMNLNKKFSQLSDYEFKIFSQWGEDGIIDFLISEVTIINKTFIEFGVEDFLESNCRFLLMNRDWRGFAIDGSERNIKTLKNSYFFWKHNLQALVAFVDRDNVNALLEKSKFQRDLGILSIDIDGNDFHVLSNINSFDPRIIICEFNPIFGKVKKLTIPYDPSFYRTKKHYSNLYYGASINAFINLLSQRGYTLVGTGMLGCNAYFVKNSLLTEHLKKLAESPFNFNFNYRESRDVHGNLNFLNINERLKEIEGMKVLDLESGNLVNIKS
jgi:hypothetical protein